MDATDKTAAKAFKQSAKIIVERQVKKYGAGWEYMHAEIRRAVCVEQIVPTVVGWGSMAAGQMAQPFAESIADLWRAVLAELEGRP